MERAISVEERIRRAEERYNRKIGQNFYDESPKTSVKEKKHSIKKKSKRKLVMYIFICLIIYIVFYGITNSEYIFSEDFKKDINSFFTEKTQIYAIYSDIKSFIENNLLGKEKANDSEETKKTQDAQGQQTTDEQSTDDEQSKGSEQTTSENKQTEGQAKTTIDGENVGGAEEIYDQENTEQVTAQTEEKTQMEKDADEIKSKLSFINPIEGRISSTFGWRNPTNPSVPKYHTGLDIAQVTGTVIKSATDGIVELVSDEGDYGKHYYIKNDNVTIIYAHCSKLYLNQGDEVKKGQEIAEVGSTGLSTGPHLHIGIKLDDRWVDPQLILSL